MDTHNIHLSEWTYKARANDGRAIYQSGADGNPKTYELYLNGDNKTGTLYQGGHQLGSATIGSYAANDPSGGGNSGGANNDSASLAALKKRHGEGTAGTDSTGDTDPPKKTSLLAKIFKKKDGAVDFSPEGVLHRFETAGAQATATHNAATLARHEMVFSYGGQTDVTKNVFMDGSATYVKNGKVLGRESAGSEKPTFAAPSPATTVAPSTAAAPAPTPHQNTTPADSSGTDRGSHSGQVHGPIATSADDWKTLKSDGNEIITRNDKTKTTMIHYRNGVITEQVDGNSAYRVSGPSGAAGSSTNDSEPHGIANRGNTGGFGGDGKDTAPTPSWNTSGIAKDLGGIGGKAITDHGNALADRDSKDGTKIIVQMSDGTYESVDKKTGDVAGAGTWGDSKGGGVATNGVSASGYTPSPTAVDWHANPGWTVTSDADKAVLGKVAPSINAQDVLEVRQGSDNNTLLRMSDGTYKSVNMSGGAVSDAGTWNKDEWAASTYSSDKNTSQIPNEALARGLPGHTPTEAVDGVPAAPAASSEPSDALSRYLANNAPAASTTTSQTSPPTVTQPVVMAPTTAQDIAKAAAPVTAASTPDLSQAYKGGAAPVSVKELKNGGVLTTTATGAVIETTAAGNSYTVKKAPPAPLTLPGSGSLDHMGLTGFDGGSAADTSNVHSPGAHGRMMEM